MSYEIARTLKNLASRLAHALGEEASRAEQRLLHTTGDNLEKNVAGHVEHDAKAAANLERAAADDAHIPTVHGGGGGESVPAPGGTRGPDVEAPPDIPDTSGWPYRPKSNVPPDLYRDYDPYPRGQAHYDENYRRPDGRPVWPDPEKYPGGGVPGTQVIDPPLPKGYRMDRFGGPDGGFLGRANDPFADRSLPVESVGKDYRQYVITGEPLPQGYHVEQATVAPWFDQRGGGTQFRVLDPDGHEVSVADLIDLGWIE